MAGTASGKSAARPRIFIDANILLDYLYFWGEEALATEYIFNVCAHDRVECCIAAHSLTNIFYITGNDYSEAARKQIVLNFCAMCRVQEISADTIEKAIAGGFSDDLEDALQMQCALDCGADFLVTRDADLLDQNLVPAIAPHSLIHKLGL